MNAEKVRKPAFAGSFYPGDAETLRFAVNQYIDGAEIECEKCNLKAVISPHAGYIYSGFTAGYSYKVVKECFQKKNSKINVFILGPAHQMPVEGLAISPAENWNTAFGSLRVSEVARKMVQQEADCVDSAEAHLQEHCIEVQLPFIQTALSGLDFEIVPILVTKGEYSRIADILEKYMVDEDLLVVSSDLCHYENYEIVNQKDKQTVDAVVNLDFNTMSQVGDACGKLPIMVVMELARRKEWKATLADYRNSGDTAGDKSSVVGYASIYFCGK